MKVKLGILSTMQRRWQIDVRQSDRGVHSDDISAKRITSHHIAAEASACFAACVGWRIIERTMMRLCWVRENLSRNRSRRVRRAGPPPPRLRVGRTSRGATGRVFVSYAAGGHAMLDMSMHAERSAVA